MKTYLIDLKVRSSKNPAKEIETFLFNQGIEVLGCNGYEDDSKYRLVDNEFPLRRKLDDSPD
jgi:hypothetical protein